jgi:hypothetical protein
MVFRPIPVLSAKMHIDMVFWPILRATRLLPSYTDNTYGLQYFPPGKSGFRPASTDVRLNAYAIHALSRVTKTVDSAGIVLHKPDVVPPVYVIVSAV